MEIIFWKWIVKKENKTTYIDIPVDVSKRFNAKGKIKVKGKVNGRHPYNKGLLSRGNGRYILTLNKGDLKRMDIDIDEKINVSIELYNQMTEVNMDKQNNSQDEIKKVLVAKLYECVNSISERQEKKGIPDDGLTLFVAEIGVDGKKFDMTIALTPEGILDEFKKACQRWAYS